MRKLVIAIVGLAATAWLAWTLVGGTTGLVEASLPDFPDFPAAHETLAADAAGEIHFRSATPYDFDVILEGMTHALPTTGVGRLTMPAGASPARPVPAVILLHGSGGMRPGREPRYAKMLADAGFAAFVVDYYAPRGIEEDHDYMTKVLAVTEFDAVTDAYAALRLLATHPSIDGDRIALVGFSYGGMATRLAMDERVRAVLAPERAGFAAFADFYGPCFQAFGTRSTNGAPLLTLRGTEDASNDLTACARREQELRTATSAVEAHVYVGAGHAWENDDPRKLHDVPYVAGCEMIYDGRGRSSVGGRPIVHVPPETSRAERVAIRMQSGDAMTACVKRGYVVGGDPPVRRKADAALLGFLRRHLAVAG